MQIALKRFQVDYYPYHLASGDKKHWPCYRESVTPHTQWQEQALTAFKTKFLDIVERNKIQHVPLTRVNNKVCKIFNIKSFFFNIPQEVLVIINEIIMQ